MITLLLAASLAAETPILRPELEPLRFLIGHCWKGMLPEGGIDTHCFEPAHGGQHVRDRHVVTGGVAAYGGETLYSWDGTANAVRFTYWNSEGGVSEGQVRKQGDRLDFGEEHYRGPDGRQMVISTQWLILAETAFDSVSTTGNGALERRIRFERAAPPVTISQVNAPDGRLNLVHETVIHASAKEIWEAISTPEGWQGWAVPTARWAEPGILETSYEPDFSPGGPMTIRHLWLASVPGHMLAFRTIKAPDGFPHFETYSRTTSVIELEPQGADRTRVRIIGSGYPDDEAGRQLLGFFREGNRISLDRLSRRFTDGPMDWATETERKTE